MHFFNTWNGVSITFEYKGKERQESSSILYPQRIGNVNMIEIQQIWHMRQYIA